MLKTKRAALSIQETADILGVGRNSVYGLIKDGRLSIIKVGRRTLIPVASIEALTTPQAG